MFDYDEPFQNLIDNLRDVDEPLRSAIVYRLSNATAEDMAELQAAWQGVPAARRQLLLSRLLDLSEVNFEVDFTAVALFALEDEDDDVRRIAVEALWENQEAPTMRHLLRLLQQDPSAGVREAAARSLGRFVLAGELDEFPRALADEVELALLEVWQEPGELPDVRRRALESISYSGREEVPSLIEEALENQELKMQASAVFAMGRSCDERWENHVLNALYHPEAELRFEAARAAGELFLSGAVRRLIEMLYEDDREIQQAAIWSLGEIGGEQAKRALMDFADDEDLDPDMMEAVEDAVNTAVLSTGEFVTYIFEMDEDDPGALDDFEGFDLADSDFDVLSDPDDE